MATTNLRIIGNGDLKKLAYLRTATTTVGRGPENDITIPDRTVSRLHARFRRIGGGYEIEDVGSRHGVLVNGERIAGPTAIEPGDQLKLGAVRVDILPDAELSEEVFDLDPASTATLGYGDFPSVSPFVDWDEVTLDSKVHLNPIVSARFLDFLDSVNFANHRPLTDLLDRIVEHSLRIFPRADRSCLLLIEEGQPVPKSARRSDEGSAPVKVSGTVVEKVIDSRRSLLSFNAQEDFVTKSVLKEGIFSVMCVPIVFEGEVLGVLYLDTAAPGKQFKESELELFTIFANTCATYIEYHVLLEERVQERIYEEQVKEAARIQRRLLVIDKPPVDGYSIHLGNIPCLAAGGDYLDTMWCQEKLFLALGDVSGKGIPAAMLTATLQAAVHAHAITSTEISQIAERVNNFLYQRTASNKFVTLFLGCLDVSSGHLTYVNAGHCPPVLFRHKSKHPERLDSTGLIIGIMPDVSYASEETHLGPGDLLCLFTDGFYEQTSAWDEEYGEERLVDFLTTHREKKPTELAESLEKEVLAFAEGVEQQDDMTQLLVKRRLQGESFTTV